MKELIQYKIPALKAMYNYLQNDNLNLLINDLYKIEIDAHFKIDEDFLKSIWFKFSKDDTLSTTIKDVKLYLMDNGKERAFMIEQFHAAIKENSLQVYFS